MFNEILKFVDYLKDFFDKIRHTLEITVITATIITLVMHLVSEVITLKT